MSHLAAAVNRWCIDNLPAELAELDKSAPPLTSGVAYQRMVTEQQRGVPVTRFRKSTGSRPVEVLR